MADEQMSVDLGIGFSKILEDIDRASEGAKRLTEQTIKAGRAATNAGKSYDRLAEARLKGEDASSPAAQARARVSRGSSGTRYATGPNQRLDDLRAQRTRAQGDPNASASVMSDLDYKIGLAQKQVNRINQGPPDFQDRLRSAFMTSRFGAGGLNPLVGRTLNAISPGLATGPAGLMIAAGLAAAKLGEEMVRLADESARVTRGFQELQQGTGGSGAQSGQLRAMGISAGEVSAFHQRITTDPTAMGFAAQLGASSIGGAYGEVNEARAYLQAIQGLRNLQGEQRIRAARNVGIDPGALALNVSDEEFKRIQGAGAASARIYDPTQQRVAADYTSSQRRLTQSTEDLEAAFSGLLLPSLTHFVKGLDDTVTGITAIIKPIVDWNNRFTPPSGEQIINELHPGAYPNAGKSSRWTEPDGGDSAGNPVIDALNAHADKLSENSDRLSETSQALTHLTRAVGGGHRADTAIPAGLRDGRNLRRAYDQGALRFGMLG